jgi:hypothetical protein
MSERQYESIRRYFSAEELDALHEQLVVHVGEVRELRGQKTQANTIINAQIKTAEKTVWDTQEKLATGYESIDVEVLAVMDIPAPGQKTIIRADTSEKIRVEPMTAREKQQSFGFHEPGAES